MNALILQKIENIFILLKKKDVLRNNKNKKMIPSKFFEMDEQQFINDLNRKSVNFSETSEIYKIIIEIRNKLGFINGQRPPHIELYSDNMLHNLKSTPIQNQKNIRSDTIDFINAIFENLESNIFKKKYWKSMFTGSSAFIIHIDDNYVKKYDDKGNFIKQNDVHITIFYKQNFIEQNQDKIYNVISEVLSKYNYKLDE